MSSRYDEILKLIDVFKPRVIAETGTWKGNNAIRMIGTAGKYHDNPVYIGYDLFEDGTKEIDIEEFNIKPHTILSDVEDHIKRNSISADIILHKGNTRETLHYLVADFAFIDGGHSLETIRHDYEALKNSSIIVLDDYYTPDENGMMPDITKVGCNKIVENIPHVIIRSNDPVKTGGYVNLALVLGV